MSDCWNVDPKKRITFDKVVKRLESLLIDQHKDVMQI